MSKSISMRAYLLHVVIIYSSIQQILKQLVVCPNFVGANFVAPFVADHVYIYSGTCRFEAPTVPVFRVFLHNTGEAEGYRTCYCSHI